MASFRRTLSPAYHDRHYTNGLFSSSSPSHKVPSSNINYSSLASSFQKLIGGVFMRRYNRKLQWRKVAFRCVIFFFAGFLLGMFPFGNLIHEIPQQQQQRNNDVAFDINNTPRADARLMLDDRFPPKRVSVSDVEDKGFVIDPISLSLNMNDEKKKVKLNDVVESGRFDFAARKQLIVVTPTYNRAFQSYFLNRLGQVLRLVPPPLLWVVVEMNSASMETAELLRKTGVMYRHLVCKKNSTDVKDRGVHQRNTALEHIEHHKIDGIVYFADDDNVYSLELFQTMRDIRYLLIWFLH
jgi:galactosylgalactosylxylosylprotein 3-beta-glucuronosyltransferase 1